MKTTTQIRAAFWRSAPPSIRRQARMVNGRTRPCYAPQNLQPTDVRVAFCDYVDSLSKEGLISEDLASRATL